jgi:hypothetical protein
MMSYFNWWSYLYLIFLIDTKRVPSTEMDESISKNWRELPMSFSAPLCRSYLLRSRTWSLLLFSSENQVDMSCNVSVFHQNGTYYQFVSNQAMIIVLMEKRWAHSVHLKCITDEENTWWHLIILVVNKLSD